MMHILQCEIPYRGNFRGPYISRIAIKVGTNFVETNFVDCMIKAQVLLQLPVSWL